MVPRVAPAPWDRSRPAPAAVEWAGESGVLKLELHVFPHNAPAIALYEKLGFEREGYRKDHYRRGVGYVDAILMAYPVDGA